MYYVAVCDDEQSFLDMTRRTLFEIFEELGEQAAIRCFLSVEQLRQSEEQFDLLLLDIMLGDDNGIEYAERLRSRGIETDIIFITSSPEFALAGYSVYPVDYLLKPINPQKLKETIKRCLRRGRAEPALLVNSKECGRIKVNLESITYCEVLRTNIIIHCKDERELTTIGTFSSFCSALPQPEFFRCHRSFVVNMKYVERIDRYKFTLSDGTEVPIAKNSYSEAKKVFVDYINPVEDFF